MIVVDASVAVKWFLPEPGSGEATLLLEAEGQEPVGPDLLAVEVAATLVRGANIVKANRDDAQNSLAKFRAMIEEQALRLRRTAIEQLDRAATLAIALGHPLKDCIYLALAMELDCPLVTADARFAAKARGIYQGVTVLGERGR